MTPWEMLAVFATSICAGALNTVVGSGTLITFPVLLAIGLPPVTATVTNALGLIPGSISGAIGYCRELRGQSRRLLKLSVAALLGGRLGAEAGRRFSPATLRFLIVAVGGVALVHLLVR
ncbi:sulfite exporter TauE/SafE family protein [Nonomuraea sp. NPDC052116]|uniref:sulfite exporter TauE/SafE family protein n=1 Tax=Nonomuraea sp. NPDC052116 TaxID=3155665 RepID=UPI003435A003